MRYFRRDLRIDRKPDRTFVTQADTAVERTLREQIEHRYPQHGVLAEEFGDRNAKQETRWIIDPIDATHSYLRGIPVFATLIALERAGVMEPGIISAPAMRERWPGAPGGGAWPGRPADASPTSKDVRPTPAETRWQPTASCTPRSSNA